MAILRYAYSTQVFPGRPREATGSLLPLIKPYGPLAARNASGPGAIAQARKETLRSGVIRQYSRFGSLHEPHHHLSLAMKRRISIDIFVTAALSATMYSERVYVPIRNLHGGMPHAHIPSGKLCAA